MRVKFITFGCSANLADTELMKGYVKDRHEIVDEDPDVIVVNTCFVKQETENKIMKLLKSIKDKKLVIAGCLAQARKELREFFPNASIIGVKRLERINDAIEEKIIDVGEGNPDFCHERVLTNKFIGIVPIGIGCLGNCSYCCTRQARGVLKSRPVESIIKQIKNDLKRGVVEFWITSQDNGCYGFDIGTNLAELMEKIDKIDGRFRVRIGMMNPQHILRFLPQLRDVFNSEKFYNFIHIPVQSGSNKVLRDMRRGYSVEEFKEIVKRFKGFNISTDIITGYPTETEEDWKETIKLIKEIKPGVLNISRFFPRPNTDAAKLKQLPPFISKRRSRELSKIYKEIVEEDNKKEIGKTKELLITKEGLGRDERYKIVKVDSPIVGFTKAKIVGTDRFYLLGEIKDY